MFFSRRARALAIPVMVMQHASLLYLGLGRGLLGDWSQRPKAQSDPQPDAAATAYLPLIQLDAAAAGAPPPPQPDATAGLVLLPESTMRRRPASSLALAADPPSPPPMHAPSIVEGVDRHPCRCVASCALSTNCHILGSPVLSGQGNFRPQLEIGGLAVVMLHL